MRVLLAVATLVFLTACASTGTHGEDERIEPADQAWTADMLLDESDAPDGWDMNENGGQSRPDDCEAIDFSDLVVTGTASDSSRSGSGCLVSFAS